MSVKRVDAFWGEELGGKGALATSLEAAVGYELLRCVAMLCAAHTVGVLHHFHHARGMWRHLVLEARQRALMRCIEEETATCDRLLKSILPPHLVRSLGSLDLEQGAPPRRPAGSAAAAVGGGNSSPKTGPAPPFAALWAQALYRPLRIALRAQAIIIALWAHATSDRRREASRPAQALAATALAAARRRRTTGAARAPLRRAPTGTPPRGGPRPAAAPAVAVAGTFPIGRSEWSASAGASLAPCSLPRGGPASIDRRGRSARSWRRASASAHSSSPRLGRCRRCGRDVNRA
mmetsp:Transcript_24609/g.81062  ORF Transcript_24609/g.81062 Transcript_24609/m.81062 type:complete len:292 (-) Transcript_24609:939-1814(-)